MSNSGTPSTSTLHNLPVRLSSFVGRAAELEQLCSALVAGRLVTISGAGGFGKTRLAIEVARRMSTSYPDGMWLVSLAPISDPGLVVQSVATAVGASELPGKTLLEALFAKLSHRELLLVLDNCEHLIDACAELADVLLRACPNVRILATSRERLRIDGETVFQLASLVVPDAEGDQDLSRVAESEAVRLFLDRARSVQPGFELTPERAPLIASICRHLEGMPLGIELAAARVGTLSLQEIDRRLGESLGVLSGGSRTAPLRQQTLTAAIEWSYNLLNETEQMVFRRLAVFHGGSTLAAAEAVCGGPGVPTDEVADVLTGLVEKSLVLVVEQPGGEVRYRPLEPLRQFGHAKLQLADEVDATLDLHLEWFAQLADWLDQIIFGPQQIAAYELIDIEMNNLRSALMRSVEDSTRIQAGIRLVRPLAPFWVLRAHTSEGLRWLRQVYAVAKAVGNPAAYTVGIRLGLFLESPETLDHIEAAVEGARGMEDQRSLCQALALSAFQHFFRDQREVALAAATEAVQIARVLGGELALARALGSLAVVTTGSGGPEAAINVFEDAVLHARASGDRTVLNANLHNLADVERRLGRHESAQAHYNEAGALLRELGASTGLLFNSLNLGLLSISMGDLRQSAQFLGEALDGAISVGISSYAAVALLGLAASAEAGTSATLLGAGYALLASSGTLSDPNDLETWEQIESAARGQLTVAEFESAYVAGQVMSLDDGVVLARSVVAKHGGAEPSILRANVTVAQPELVEQLTARERETLRLLASGLTNKEIAAAMVVSVRTVENHVANLYGKIGARGRADATAFALSHGLMNSPA